MSHLVRTSIAGSSPYVASMIVHIALIVTLMGVSNGDLTRSRLIEIDWQTNEVAETAKVLRPRIPKQRAAVQQVNPNRMRSESAAKESSSVPGSAIGITAHYPRLSRMLKETGSVLIAVDGVEAAVSRSSGHERLDRSALEATRAALENGTLTEFINENSHRQISFVFRLIEIETRRE